jgi:hypothetical protein
MAELPATGRATAPRRRHPQWPVVLLAVAVLAACFAYASASGRDRAGTTSTDEPPSDVLVTYVREGGITGERTRLTVAAGGTATLDIDGVGGSTGWTRQLPDDRLQALRTALGTSGFHDLEATYRHAGVCNDCIVDTVTYRGRSVSVQGSAVPPGLAEVLRLLSRLATDA